MHLLVWKPKYKIFSLKSRVYILNWFNKKFKRRNNPKHILWSTKKEETTKKGTLKKNDIERKKHIWNLMGRVHYHVLNTSTVLCFLLLPIFNFFFFFSFLCLWVQNQKQQNQKKEHPDFVFDCLVLSINLCFYRSQSLEISMEREKKKSSKSETLFPFLFFSFELTEYVLQSG